MKKIFKLIGLSLIIVITSCKNNTNNKTSDITNEELMKKGMYNDPKTGLTWMRFSIGQEWENGEAIGDPFKFKYEDGIAYVKHINKESFGGYSDWRLPKIKELASLRKCSCGDWARENPARKVADIVVPASGKIIKAKLSNGSFAKSLPKECGKKDESLKKVAEVDNSIFSITEDAFYMTSSQYTTSSMNWVVNFSTGTIHGSNLGNGMYVILVRD